MLYLAKADDARVRRRSAAVAVLRGAMVAEVRTGSVQGCPVVINWWREGEVANGGDKYGFLCSACMFGGHMSLRDFERLGNFLERYAHGSYSFGTNQIESLRSSIIFVPVACQASEKRWI